jgi:oxygen-dependent protoporphyrinogen oxidase
MLGGALHPELVDASNEDLLTMVRRDVFDVMGVKGDPEMTRVFRHRRAIPQYGLDHAEVLSAADAAERAHPGLYFTGSAYRGVAMIDCVADAFRVADRIVSASSTP